MPDENLILNELEIEVGAELSMAQSSHPEEEIGEGPATWAFDPADVEREEIGLRNLLGAVTTLETESGFSGRTPAPRDTPGG